MNINVGDKGVLTFGDNTKARVKVVDIDTHSYVPTDYWFEYEEGETNKQIVHPEFGKQSYIKSSVVLPETLVSMVFKKTNSKEEQELEENSFEYKLQEYLDKNMAKENHNEARMLFNSLKKLKTEEEIIKEYFNN